MVVVGAIKPHNVSRKPKNKKSNTITMPMLRQNLYFCTSKASKLSTWSVLLRAQEGGGSKRQTWQHTASTPPIISQCFSISSQCFILVRERERGGREERGRERWREGGREGKRERAKGRGRNGEGQEGEGASGCATERKKTRTSSRRGYMVNAHTIALKKPQNKWKRSTLAAAPSLLRQYLYHCTRKTSKLRTTAMRGPVVDVLQLFRCQYLY